MRVAAIDQDQNYNSERKTTLRRAASVPVARRENPRLESLRLRKQSSSLDVKHTPPSSPSTSAVGEDKGHRSTRRTTAARGLKRGPPLRGTPQTHPMDGTSTLVAEPITDGEQRPRKRRKRSPTPSAAASSSQFSAPSQSRRRTRSRVGSPVADVEYVPPLRAFARRGRKTHPFINCHSPDIYTHLADPDSAGHLLSEPSTSSITFSTSKDMSRSQSVGNHRGRRKTIDLGDELTKKNLMEEWAQLRQSRVVLPLSGIDQNACLGKMPRRDTRDGGGSASPMQLQPTIRGDPDLVESQATTVAVTSPSEEAVIDILSDNAPMDVGDNSLGVQDAFENGPVYNGETEQATVPAVGAKVRLIPVSDLPMDEDFPNDKPTGASDLTYHHEGLQFPGSSPPVPSLLVSRDGLAHVRHDEQARASSVNMSKMASLDGDGAIHVDFDEEFYMLDIPEMFTLPWVPVSSHLYVPPGLGKLISGMREQLTMATRARQRAEELYQAELNRRISAEKVIEELQAGLEERQNEFAGRATCWAPRRQRASSAPFQRNSNQ